MLNPIAFGFQGGRFMSTSVNSLGTACMKCTAGGGAAGEPGDADAEGDAALDSQRGERAAPEATGDNKNG